MIRAGNSRGLDGLHQRYAAYFKGIARRIIHDEMECEDAVQEALIEIWNQSTSYQVEKGRPISWISTIIRRRSIDHLRKRNRQDGLAERFTTESRVRECGWKTHVEEDFALSEMQHELKRVLALLPEQQRQAIELTYFQGMTQREISSLTGIPLGTVKTRIELGMRKISQALYGWRDLISGSERRVERGGGGCLSVPGG